MSLMLSLLGFSALIFLLGVIGSFFKDRFKGWIVSALPANLDFMPKSTSSFLSFALTGVLTCLVTWFYQSSIVNWRSVKGFNLTTFSACSEDLSCLLQQVSLRVCASYVALVFGQAAGLYMADNKKLYEVHSLGFSYKSSALILFTTIFSLGVSNSTMNYFSALCLLMSPLYQALQTITLVEMAYTWNESWVAKAESQDTSPSHEVRDWYRIILISSFLLFGICGILVIIFTKMFISKFAFMLIFTYCIVFASMSFVSITNLCPNGSLLTSAAVSLYGVLQLFSVLAPLIRHPLSATICASVKLFFWLASISLTIYVSHKQLPVPPTPEVIGPDYIFENQAPMNQQRNPSSRFAGNLNIQPTAQNSNLFNQNSTAGIRDRRSSQDEQPPKVVQQIPVPQVSFPLMPTQDVRQYKLFHFLVLCSAFVMHLTLTNWNQPLPLNPSIAGQLQFDGSGVMATLMKTKFASLAKHPMVAERILLPFDTNIDEGSPNVVTINQKGMLFSPFEMSASFWIELMGGLGTTTLLYGWTLVAPRVFPNRDFT